MSYWRFYRLCIRQIPPFTISENRIRNTGIRTDPSLSALQFDDSVDRASAFRYPFFCLPYSETGAVARGNWPGFARTRYAAAALSRFASEGWWSRSGSNRRPQACKARALPTELRPRSTFGWLAEAKLRDPRFDPACRAVARGNWPGFVPSGYAAAAFSRFASEGWWARDELNVRPHAYQACALTT